MRAVLATLAALAVALGLGAVTLVAQSQTSSTTGPLRPVSHQRIAVGGTAVGLAPATLNPGGVAIKHCWATVEGSDGVRYLMDGTAPTSNAGVNPVGHLVTPAAQGDPRARIDMNSYAEAAGFLAIDGSPNGITLQVTCEQ